MQFSFRFLLRTEDTIARTQVWCVNCRQVAQKRKIRSLQILNEPETKNKNLDSLRAAAARTTRDFKMVKTQLLAVMTALYLKAAVF